MGLFHNVDEIHLIFKDRNLQSRVVGTPRRLLWMMAKAAGECIASALVNKEELHNFCMDYAATVERYARKRLNAADAAVSASDDDADLPYDWEGGTE